MKRAAWFTAIVLATLTAVVVLWQFRNVLGLFLISLAIAATVRPLIDRLIDRGVPTGLAMLIVYVVGIVSVIFLLVAISPPLSRDVQRLTNDFTLAYEQARETWPQGSILQQTLAAQLPATSVLLEQVAGEQGRTLAETALGLTLSVFDLISHFLLVLVLSLYWSADQVRFERLWLSLLPSEQRARARAVWRGVEAGLGAYIRSELFQSFLAVLVLTVLYTLIGLKFPIVVALVSAVLWLIPLVGGLLVIVLVVAVGLSSSPLIAVGALAITIGVLLVLELRVEPRLFDRRGYNPILVLLVMIAMTDAFGLLGLIAAPVLAVAIQICINELASPASAVAPGVLSGVTQPASAQVTQQVQELRGRLATVRQMLAQMEEPSPRLESMTERLEDLVKELAPIVEEEQNEGNPSTPPTPPALGEVRGGR